MAIKTSCPHCSESYTLADTQIGKKVRCKSCSDTFTVRNGKAPRPRDDEDDRPLPRPRKKGGVPAGLLIGGGIAAVLLLLVCLGGAGGLILYFARTRVTEENYAKLRMGMSEAEVKAILGEPTEASGLAPNPNFAGNAPRINFGVRVLVWRNGPDHITVSLLNDKVVGMGNQFRKAGGGVHIQTRT